MAGLYDQLLDQIDDEGDEKPAGLTPLDMAELPEAQHEVMFLLLRDKTASRQGVTLEFLQAKVEDAARLPDILAELTKNSWLILMGEPPKVRYKVNFRRKRGTKSRSLWASLADRLIVDEDEQENQADTSASSKSKGADKGKKPGLPMLSDWQ